MYIYICIYIYVCIYNYIYIMRRRHCDLHCAALHGTQIAVGEDVGRVSPGADVGQPRTRAVGLAIDWRAGTTAGGAARSCATSARGAPATTRTSRTPSTHRLSGYSHRGAHAVLWVLTRYPVARRSCTRLRTVLRAAASPHWHTVPVRMWPGASPVPVRMWQGVSPSPGADVARGEPKSRCGFAADRRCLVLGHVASCVA
jgi:hypothetical protein